jgi:cytochrome c oxidase cbb3-type subunit 1/cytochrome c oxidase cbb3-type subunit I/II
MIIGALYGLTGAIEFVAPDLLKNISWLVFGRIRTVHTNLVIFGFVVPALLSVGHFIVPHLLKTELYSEKIGVLTVVIWNIFTAAILITLSMGMNQAREYAEAIWPIDIAVAIVFVLMIINLLMTIRRRQETILYVSVWYITAGVILSLFVYAIGNVVWVPGAGALTGIPDAVILWFYGHNVLGLLLTPLAVGIAYYVIPSAIRSPLYSHTLSLVGFWSLLVLYSHIGTHHLIQVPAPTWLKVVSITGSIGMVIPVMVVLINLWFTAKGKLGVIQQNIGAKFVFAGSVIYLFTCIQGPMQSLPQVQRLTHFNNWVVAHAHMGVLGFSGMMAIGGIYYMLPIITGRPIFSRKLADFHYWMLFMVVLTMAGLVQGHGWLNGETIYRMLPQIHPYYIVRAGIGMLIVTGSIIGMYNITRTIFYKPGETA